MSDSKHFLISQFAVAQYSTSFTIHLNFKHFEPQTWKTKIDEIKQKEQYTYTAAAIQKVV